MRHGLVDAARDGRIAGRKPQSAGQLSASGLSVGTEGCWSVPPWGDRGDLLSRSRLAWPLPGVVRLAVFAIRGTTERARAMTAAILVPSVERASERSAGAGRSARAADDWRSVARDERSVARRPEGALCEPCRRKRGFGQHPISRRASAPGGLGRSLNQVATGAAVARSAAESVGKHRPQSGIATAVTGALLVPSVQRASERSDGPERRARRLGACWSVRKQVNRWPALRGGPARAAFGFATKLDHKTQSGEGQHPARSCRSP